MNPIISYVEAHQEDFIKDLVEFLKIPSISAQPDHRKDWALAANQLRSKLEALGLKTELYQTDKHPVVYAEWLKKANAPTILLYGHYDVQPPDPLDLWISPPFEPRIEEGKLFARGASDDKGPVFAHLKAVESFLKTQGDLPINVKFVIEGEEEIGSPDFIPFVQSHTDLLSCDGVVISDSPMWAEGVPALCYGLRGLMAAEIEVQGPNRDLHSGMHGGAVPNPINLLCQLIAKLHDADGRIAIPGFYDAVRPLEDWEKEEFAKLGFDEEEYRKDLGIKDFHGEKGYDVLQRRWVRPTLDINGISGGYQGAGTKTVIPATARAKLSMRIVPDQQPEKISRLLENYLKSICPKSVELRIRQKAGGPAVLLPTQSPIIDAAKKAFQKGFGREPVMTREGASINIVGIFASALKAPCLLMGFGLPDDNLHSPNEKFNLDCYFNGIKTLIYFMKELGGSSQ